MLRNRFVRRPVTVLLLAVFLTACGGSTRAPAVDPKTVKERLDQFVAAVTTPRPGDGFKAKAEGSAKVETSSDGTVTGTLPRLTFTGSDGETAMIDPVTISFGDGGDGKIKVDAKIPQSLAVRDRAGKIKGEVRIGSQSLTGIWVDRLQSLTEADMRLTNLTISSPDNPGTGKVAQIALTGKMVSKGGGLYDGTYDFTTSGFSVDDPKDKTSFRMETLGLSTTIKGARLEDWAVAAREAGYTLANAGLYKTWAGGKIDDKTIAFFKKMPAFMGDVSYTYKIDGISMKQGGAQAFAMKKASLGFGAGADGQGSTRISMSFGIGGISAGGDEALLPPEADIDDAKVQIDVSGVPGQKLWDIYMDALPTLQAEAAKAAAQGATGAEDPATAGTQALEDMGSELSVKFLEVMSTSKLSLALKQLSLSTPTAKVGGDGRLTYLPAQSLLPEGDIRLRFSGIEALAKAMQRRGPKDEMAQQIMGMVAAVRAMGKPDPTSSPSDRAYTIDIKFTKDGKVLANGQSMLGN